MSFDRRAWAKRPENAAKNRERARAAGRAHTERLAAIKLAAGCMDCGYAEDAGRLHFDHRPGTAKRYNLAVMGTHSRVAVDAEMAKCDVRCVRCHKARHDQKVV